MTENTEREQRRKAFAEIFAAMPGTMPERIAKICAILGYRPNTIRVLLCRTQAWKVIPEAKLTILRRELQREAEAAAKQ